MTAHVVVFLGPTLPPAEARRILEATYLPPAREGDLISAVTTYRPRVIGLIDGAFGQSLSVWHKEILFALETGIHVYGASSIGALRAAETSAFGMVGVGEVHRMYASAELEDDDEVALAHAGAEDGYRGLSVPMVNLRKTFILAREMGVCDHAICDTLLAVAKAIYYPERTIPRVIGDAVRAGVPAGVAESVRQFIEADYVDIKRQDAITLLQTLRDLPPDLPPFAAAFRLERPRFFNALYERDRTVRHSGVDVALHAIADYAALHLAEFDDLNLHALNRAIAVEIAEVLGIQVPPDRIESEAARFRQRRGLQDQEAFLKWLARNDLTAEEWTALMCEVALCRHLHAWLMLRKGTGNSRAFLDELRLADTYEAVCAAATNYERILQTIEPEELFVEANEHGISELVPEQAPRGCDAGPNIAEWAEQSGFATLADLRVELVRARIARERVDRAARALLTLTTDTPPTPPSWGQARPNF